MCHGNTRAWLTGICSAVCLGWALGIFFGLNYPEIRRNTVFVETNCTVGDPVSVVPYRYCYKTCSYCTQSFDDGTCSSTSLFEGVRVRIEACGDRSAGPGDLGL